MISIVIATLLLGILFHHFYFQQRPPLKLPPGPKPIPFVGNILELPPRGMPEYQHWLSFKDAYGLISSATIMGTTLIILHDKQAARDLLDKKASRTSARPRLVFANELCGFETLLPSQQYDATFRQQRKLIHQQFGTKTAVARFRDIQDVESRQLLLRLLDSPNKLTDHVKTAAGAIVLKITYGYSVETQVADPLVVLIERMMHDLSLALIPMAWSVDAIPILKYLPAWFPGASFKTVAQKCSDDIRMVVDIPYAFARRQIEKGIRQQSYVASLVEHYGQSSGGTYNLEHDIETAIKRTAAVIYAGGADTTVSTISSFVLAMMLYPSVQRKAQEEIDTVLGCHSLPQFDDRGRLPYVDALIKESLRWIPVVPIGTTHATEEEMIYAGFRIPKGAYLLPCIWWYLHDPQVYADPSSFDPSRFLKPRNEPDPKSEAFGYGRRICPGRYLADENLYITISRMLATFNIKKAVDENGNTIEPKIEVTAGLVSRPVAFPFNIEPRSIKHMEMVKAIEIEHPQGGSDAHLLQ